MIEAEKVCSEMPSRKQKRKQYIAARREEYEKWVKQIDAKKTYDWLVKQTYKVGGKLINRGPGKIEKPG